MTMTTITKMTWAFRLIQSQSDAVQGLLLAMLACTGKLFSCGPPNLFAVYEFAVTPTNQVGLGPPLTCIAFRL